MKQYKNNLPLIAVPHGVVQYLRHRLIQSSGGGFGRKVQNGCLMMIGLWVRSSWFPSLFHDYMDFSQGPRCPSEAFCLRFQGRAISTKVNWTELTRTCHSKVGLVPVQYYNSLREKKTALALEVISGLLVYWTTVPSWHLTLWILKQLILLGFSSYAIHLISLVPKWKYDLRTKAYFELIQPLPRFKHPFWLSWSWKT